MLYGKPIPWAPVLTSAEQQIARLHHQWGTGSGVWKQICWLLLSGHRLRRSTQRCDTRRHSSCAESPNKSPFTSDKVSMQGLNIVPYKDAVSRARDLTKLLAEISSSQYIIVQRGLLCNHSV